MTNGFPPGFIDPVLEPPDIEFLAQYYLTPYLSPTPIATRLPQPGKTEDNIHGFLRVEAGGGNSVNAFQDCLTTILHGYSPKEIQASWICRTAFKWMKAAHGQKIAGWYVAGIENSVLPHRLSDPNVIGLTRYRAMVTWRVPGLVGGS